MDIAPLSLTTCLDTDDVFCDGNEPEKIEDGDSSVRRLRPRKLVASVSKRDLTKQIREVVARRHHSLDEKQFLDQHCSLVKAVRASASSYSKLKQRSKEVLDEPVVFHAKCIELARALQLAKHAIVYTGAGISTAANIPDYRGTNGVWTRLKSGKDIGACQDLVRAVPTYTHMCIEALMRKKILHHVVSQNCDGLHIRSGIASEYLSELHGNMYCEVCLNCDAKYYRTFDVTENTSFRRHLTGRKCNKCLSDLKDTIVHFGERSDVRWPHSWKSAEANAEKADLILCLGSSLKILRSYKSLWLTDRPKRNRPKLFIVNLQWTPKDSQATSKINGTVDEVMKIVMPFLSIIPTTYTRLSDPLFLLASEPMLNEVSVHTTSSISDFLLDPSVYKNIERPFSEADARLDEQNFNGSTCSQHGRTVSDVKINLPHVPLYPTLPAISDQNVISTSESVTEEHKPEQAIGDQIDSAVQCVVSEAPAWFGMGYRKPTVRKFGARRKSKRKPS